MLLDTPQVDGLTLIICFIRPLIGDTFHSTVETLYVGIRLMAPLAMVEVMTSLLAVFTISVKYRRPRSLHP